MSTQTQKEKTPFWQARRGVALLFFCDFFHCVVNISTLFILFTGGTSNPHYIYVCHASECDDVAWRVALLLLCVAVSATAVDSYS